MAACSDDTDNSVKESPKLAVEISSIKYKDGKEVVPAVGDQILFAYRYGKMIEYHVFERNINGAWTCPDEPAFAYSDTLKFEATYKGVQPCDTEASVANNTIRQVGDKLQVDLIFKVVTEVSEEDKKPVPEGYDRAIYDRNDLLKFMQEANGTYEPKNSSEEYDQDKVLEERVIQMADIKLSDRDEWTPIGHSISTSYFSGIYNGNGYKIFNMQIKSHKAYNGMFGHAKGAILYGINLDECKLLSNESSFLANGMLVGRSETSTITLCSSTGLIEGNLNVGGLVGRSDGSNISRCWSSVSVVNYGMNNSPLANTGGLVGFLSLSSKIAGCYATPKSIEGESYSAGGLVGKADSSSFIFSCYASGEIVESIANLKGGLIGECENASNVCNSYARVTNGENETKFHELLSGASEKDTHFCWWPTLGGSPKDVVTQGDEQDIIQMSHVVVDDQGNDQPLLVSTSDIIYQKYWDVSGDFPTIDFSYNNE